VTDSAGLPELVQQALLRPLVRINQAGYLPDGPKRATVITDAVEPLAFQVTSADGRIVHSGTTVHCVESSPFPSHTIDFSSLDLVGEGFTIEVNGVASSERFSVERSAYDGLFSDAVRFFYAQRSGIEIADSVMPGYGRPAGHIGIPPNQGDTAVGGWMGPAAERFYPGWTLARSIDVSGGWYDAGDHGKYVVNGGLSASLLLAGQELLDRHQVDAQAFLTPGPSLLDEALWEVDWMTRMQVPSGEQHAGLAFHRVHDDHWTPLPLAPHDDPARRVIHRPSTAAGLNLAAVAAHAARIVRSSRPDSSRRLLDVAERAYAAALREPLVLAPDDRGEHGGGPYNDDELSDEFYWAATELYLTTGDERYRNDVLDSPCHVDDVFDPAGFDWDTVAAFARLELAVNSETRLPDARRIRASVVKAADRLIDVQAGQSWEQPYAPNDGWDWGSNGRILNNLIVLATAHDLTDVDRYRAGFLNGLAYLFGRNPIGLSFVTGYGTHYSHRQRVRHFAHALDQTFPPPPRGSVAGGAASKIYPGFPGDPRFAGLPDQLCYVDEPTSETTNDICIRWNASLVWVAAYLIRLDVGSSSGTTRANSAFR
jgi:endoglucanase